MVRSTLSRSANHPAQAGHWLACGWRLVHRRPQLFFAMSFWYLLLAVLLTRLPFLGPLILVLVTPALAAGAWLTFRDLADEQPPQASPHGMNTFLRLYVAQPLHALFRALRDERRTVSTIVLCLVCLGLVMALKIVEYVLIGGSLVSALQSPEVMSWLRPVTMAAVLVVITLAALTTMGLIFVVPLVSHARLDAFAALARSFGASMRSWLPLAFFVLSFVAAYVAINFAFAVSMLLGYFTSFTLGPILLASFLGGLSCSYNDVFPDDPTTVAHSA